MLPDLRKPARGSYVLDREQRRHAIVKAERLAKAAARKRDHWGCRFPAHKCRGELEVAHIFRDLSLGGSSETSNLMTLCSSVHRRGTPSIHGKQLRVEPEDDSLGADGPCSFWRLDEHGIWICVGVESAIGVLRND